MMYKTYLSYIFILLNIVLIAQLDATSCKRSCKTTSCNTQTAINFDCLPKITDYIIVGLGTAGATLARYLSDPIDGQYTNNVIVLEVGQNYNQDPEVLNPSLFASSALAASTKYSLTYTAFPGNANFGFNLLGYTDGRMWGGGSGHNGMISVRGTPFLYDQWVTASGSAFWSYNNLLPLMKFLETYRPNGGGFDATQRGDAGPLTISQDLDSLVSANLFVQNCVSTLPNTNIPIIGDYNINTSALGVCQLQLNNTLGQFTPGSHRTFSANSFLPTPADNPTNPIITEDGIGLNGRKLKIVSHAHVSRVIFENNRAVGVEYIFADNPEQIFTLFAQKEVILCAGTVQDVAILQRSGIGPQAVLDPLGITAVFYNDNVGINMQNHYGSSCIMTADVDTIAPPLAQFFTDCAPYFNGSQPADGVRRVQTIFGAGPFFFYDLGIPVSLIGPQVLNPEVFPTNSFGLTIVTPQSRGTIVVPDTNPLTTPIVNFGFWTDGTGPGSDYDTIVASFKIVRDMAHQCGQTMIYPTESMFTDDAQLRFAATNGTFVTYHAAGSCRMGTSSADAVVDDQLRVFGVTNLRIADCSIMPIISDGNTAIPAYYIGAALAKLLGNQTLP